MSNERQSRKINLILPDIGIAGVLKRTEFGKLYSRELNKKKKVGFSSCPAWLQFTQQLTAGRNEDLYNTARSLK
jgi:hypothetical protein